METVTVEIPIHYLLILACHGNMGDGEIPALMKRWAESQCRESGYDRELAEMRLQKVRQIRSNLSNLIGEDGMRDLDNSIKETLSNFRLDK